MTTSRKAISSPLSTEKTKTNDYIELKLPKVSRSNRVVLLVLVLIGLAFFAGFQTAKVTYWEQKEKTLSSALTAGQPVQPSPTPAFYKVGNGHLPVMGKANAKVTIIEFSDLQCLFCRRFWQDTLPQIKKDYIDKGLVKFAYRHYPLPPELHPAARPLAEGAECANAQDKFWEFHDKVYQEQALQGEGTIPVSDDNISTWASQLGLDLTAFNECFSNKSFTERIDTDVADGQKVNAQSTPTFYVNGQILVGALPYSAFKTVIDQQLKK